MTSDSISAFHTRSLTRPQYKDFQKHHLIPVQIFRNPNFARLFEIVRVGGFDPRDFQTNGVYLPATERMAIQCGWPLHRGPHPRYNELVASRLAMLEKSIMRRRDKDQVDHYHDSIASRLYYIQKALRKTLLSKPSPIILNRRDPMSRNIDFKHLDDDVDRLWGAIS